ncbi:maleylpyruvate isomerase N-terminal domain-containing protein [Nocardia cyriacigeorgica]|uniref:maleylpyruvate isomerase N-terminal domain-containing protein n=1 Tax=Nocardia cyriacigeorgica TaxID=135487 RepID=UPI001E3BD270|nr:maleylpyruvate isomerase N-terminal domain-containing protein [Nocardia cyriacigeorgica]
MEPQFDFAPAAHTLGAVVAGITDDQLDAPTPCADTSVRQLLAHVVGLTEASGRPPPRNPRATPRRRAWTTRCPPSGAR